MRNQQESSVNRGSNLKLETPFCNHSKISLFATASMYWMYSLSCIPVSQVYLKFYIIIYSLLCYALLVSIYRNFTYNFLFMFIFYRLPVGEREGASVSFRNLKSLLPLRFFLGWFRAAGRVDPRGVVRSVCWLNGLRPHHQWRRRLRVCPRSGRRRPRGIWSLAAPPSSMSVAAPASAPITSGGADVHCHLDEIERVVARRGQSLADVCRGLLSLVLANVVVFPLMEAHQRSFCNVWVAFRTWCAVTVRPAISTTNIYLFI